MQIDNNLHLTYCSNIHPGETWNEVFNALKKNVPSIKESISPARPFGIGLRLSNVAAAELLTGNHLDTFKAWLAVTDCYVFTMNGFPYGEFHNAIVKEQVYKPGWTTGERVRYTLNLVKILSHLMPGNSEAGISTSPVSYKQWFTGDYKDAFYAASANFITCVTELYHLRQSTGKYIHIDIEPEPGCLLENSKESIDFFHNYLIPHGIDSLKKTFNKSDESCAEIIKDHINICYDVCHFAVEYEEPGNVIRLFKNAGIKIGKVQLSAALKILIKNNSNRSKILEHYKPFAESTYLHQTIVKDSKGQLHHFNDLPDALIHFNNPLFHEWRTHYHVPIFMNTYNELQSTQEEILKVLKLLELEKFTNHLEVETYTWEVLPKKHRLSLQASVLRELQWVLNNYNTGRNE